MKYGMNINFYMLSALLLGTGISVYGTEKEVKIINKSKQPIWVVINNGGDLVTDPQSKKMSLAARAGTPVVTAAVKIDNGIFRRSKTFPIDPKFDTGLAIWKQDPGEVTVQGAMRMYGQSIQYPHLIKIKEEGEIVIDDELLG
jgi:hypothetical protein